MVRVKSQFKTVYSGRKYRPYRKREGTRRLPKEVLVDYNNKDEVSYLFGVYIDDPNVKIYLRYSDGTEKRIKTHERYFYNFIMIIKNIIKYKKAYLYLLFPRFPRREK